jgi:aminoglycoside 6-adenylyltransferase
MFGASTEKTSSPQPTQDEFVGVVNDFLYHAVFTAKHMRRGELWWTVTCLNCHMQHLLLRMIEWHALATHGWKRDTWFRGRFLEEWAHPEAVNGLRQAFAHYDRKDIKLALSSTIDLFRRLATETATNLSYPYPLEADKNVTEWITTCISEASDSRR